MSRIVIITGGSSGIGRALGAALVARGDDVVLAARTEADVQRAAGELSAQGPGKARGAVLDVRNADEVADLVNDVYGSYGRLDLMINNAGIGVIGFADELTLGYWERIYDTNVRGVLHGVLAAYPIMIKQGHGQIANNETGPDGVTCKASASPVSSMRRRTMMDGLRTCTSRTLCATDTSMAIPELSMNCKPSRSNIRRSVSLLRTASTAERTCLALVTSSSPERRRTSTPSSSRASSLAAADPACPISAISVQSVVLSRRDGRHGEGDNRNGPA